MKPEITIATKSALAAPGIKIKTNIKAGRIMSNHNQSIAGVRRARVSKPAMKAKAICLMAAVVFSLALSIPAQAQLDPGTKDIIQNGIKVGIIYVPQRNLTMTCKEGSVGTCTEWGYPPYVEHWVLFDNYIYPGKDQDLRTTIVPSSQKYESEEDFFARVPWGPGYRYVRADCKDTDRLPGR